MQWYKTSMQARLLTIVLGGTLLVLLVANIGINLLTKNIDNYNSLVEDHIVYERDILKMNFLFKVQVQEWKNVLLRGKDTEKREKYWNRFHGKQKEIQELGQKVVSGLKDSEATPKVQEFLSSHKKAYEQYKNGFEAFSNSGYDHTVGDKAVSGIDRAPTKLLAEAVTIAVNEDTEKGHLLHEKSQTIPVKVIAGVIVITLLLTIFVKSTLTRSVIKPLQYLMGEINKLSQGDFSDPIALNNKDELGKLAADLESMRLEIVSIFSAVQSTAAELSDASMSINQAAANIATHTGETEGYTNQVSTAVNELNSTVQEVASGASNAANSAQLADESAQKGLNLMDKTTTSLNGLSKEVDHVTEAMDKLEQDTASVGAVLDVIKGIAEQTNLLALNAAIEAARAGEQGRGFAVVADEVRALAQRTQESTEEIQQIIETVQNGASAAVKAMSSSKEQTQSTVELANDASASISEITQSVGSIRDQNTQIATAAEEQSYAASEISKNVDSMAALAKEAHSTAQESTAIANQLDNTAAGLKTLIQRFSV